MRKRVIGGTVYAVCFYLSLLTNSLFLFFALFISIFGLIEMINLIKKSDVKVLNILYLLVFITYLYAIIKVWQVNPAVIVYFSAVVMFCDTFAFLVGKKFGKTKFSKYSPNKTVEGLIGGVILGPIAAIAVLEIVPRLLPDQLFILNIGQLVNYNPFNSLIILYIVSIFLSLVAVFGDLTESYFKRHAKVKDSGNIIYGHGGVLDRQDSLIFTLIIVAIFLI